MKTYTHLFAILLLAAFLTGCNTAERMLDEGDYDGLIELANRKMKGKKNKPDKYVIAAEDAFKRVTKRDMDRIAMLQRRGTASDWERVIYIAEDIDRRQRLLEPMLPLVGKDGYRARFEFVNTEEILGYAANEVVDRLYHEANELLLQARGGDKISARQAYDQYSRIFDYTSVYRNALTLREEALALGTSHVRIVQVNNAAQLMPEYMSEMLLQDFPVADAFWTKFVFEDDTATNADVEARFEITSVNVSPESVRVERNTRTRRIEDGWEYVLDVNGTVSKDSLGNDIRETRYTTVRADVIRTYQAKDARIEALLHITDLSTGRTIASRPLYAIAQFRHTARTFIGDERALRSSERRFVRMESFPSDDQLLLRAINELKPKFVRELTRNRYLTT